MYVYLKKLLKNDIHLKKEQQSLIILCLNILIDFQLFVKNGNDPDMPEIDRKKYLVPKDLGVNQFIYIIRTRMKLSPEKVIYFYKRWITHTGGCISEYYHKYKDDDGFLYISYSGENTFG